MKYPFDRFVAQTSTKTLSVEAHLSKRADEDDSPLMVFSKFSRFVMTIIKEKKAIKMNIPVDLVSSIVKRTDAAVMLQAQNQVTPSAGGAENNSPAFTERFKTGSLAGKSPVDVLLENKDDPQKAKDILNGQYTWLKNNLAKYPANKKLMDAIVASAKVDLSTIKDSAPASLKPLTILDIGTRPLVRNTREDGKSFCYEGKVTWDFTKNYPVTVSISNYYAPVVKRDNGTLNVQLSQKADNETVDYSMTAEDWIECVARMDRSVDIYERMYMPEMIKKAEDADKANRQAAGNGNNAN